MKKGNKVRYAVAWDTDDKPIMWSDEVCEVKEVDGQWVWLEEPNGDYSDFLLKNVKLVQGNEATD